MSSAELSEEEVSSLVMVAEGAFAELSSLGQSSDEEELQASVDVLLEERTSSLSCQFAGRVNSTNVDAVTALLEVAVSREFRKSSSKFYLLL